jgi:vacuole morphology and inheritance protein 14
MLLQLSQLVKLIDMPHYATMRMQLLEPDEYSDLIRALKGLLMLLPQGKAFDSLKLVTKFFLIIVREWRVQACYL